MRNCCYAIAPLIEALGDMTSTQIRSRSSFARVLSIRCPSFVLRGRIRLPWGFELVYDNYNALGGFSPTPQLGHRSLSCRHPKWVTLFFFNGCTCQIERILQGSGARIRSLHLQPFSLLGSEAVEELLAQTVRPLTADLAAAQESPQS
jgi:hypothetical protein